MTFIPMKQKVLSENKRIAASLRERFHKHGTLAINLISSPGSRQPCLKRRGYLLRRLCTARG
jgi:hydrogenase nickel incorporation protein HypB